MMLGDVKVLQINKYKCVQYFDRICSEPTIVCLFAPQEVPQDVLDGVKQSFVRCRDKILSSSQPWTSWALVHLLKIDDWKIDDCKSVPAEKILYAALNKERRVGITIRDPVVQQNFVTSTHSADFYWQDNTKCPGKHRRWIMEHANSTISASEMYEFITQVHNRDLGALHFYMKSKPNPVTKRRKLSVRMKKLVTRVMKACPYMLKDIPGSM